MSGVADRTHLAEQLAATTRHLYEQGWMRGTSGNVSVIAEEAAILVETAVLNRRLADSREQLKALNRMKDEFVSTVSHEFKTPLAGNAFDALFGGDDGKEWLLRLPEMPAFSRYVRPPGLFAANGRTDNQEIGLDKRPVLLEYLPALYLNHWLSAQQTSIPSTV